MNRRLLAYVVPLVIVWGSMAGLLVGPLSRLAVPVVVFVNLCTGLVFLVAYLAITKDFGSIRRLTGGQWLRLAAAGSLGSFLYYTLYFYGLQKAGSDSAIEVNTMNYLFPIMTVIFSAIILRERVTVLGLVSVAVSLAGAYVIVTRGEVFNMHLKALDACLFGVAGAVVWGLFSALGRKWGAEPAPSIFVYYLTGTVLNGIWIIMLPGPVKVPSWGDFATLAYVGMISNCLGSILWFKALQVSNATLVGNITYSAAFLSVVVIHVLARSPIRPTSLVGLLLISAGVLLASRYGSVKKLQE